MTLPAEGPRPVVLLTGASRGIGAAAATWAARLGAHVAIAGRTIEGLAATAEAIEDHGGTVDVHVVDLTRHGAPADLVSRVIRSTGRLDALVSNAADIRPIATVEGSHQDDWRRAVALNLLVPVELMRSALPELRASHGRAIAVGSTAAHRPIPSLGAYAATKAALHRLVSVVAVEEPDVTALTFLPGRTDTAMHGTIRAEGGASMSTEQHAEFHHIKDSGGLASPDVPGRLLAWTALYAPPTWSGREVDRSDAEVVDLASVRLSDVGG